MVAGLLLLLGSPREGAAQYVEVKTQFDTNQIRIGEAFHLDIQVHQPAGIKVDFPQIRDTLIDKVEVLGSWPADTTLHNGELEILKRYKLTSFDSGLYVVPPMVFRFHSPVWTDSLESNPLFLYVHTVATDSTIYDVKSPLHMPVAFLEVFPFVLGGIIFFVGIGFLYWYLLRKRRNKPIFRPARPEEPAHVIAFRELRELEDEKLWQRNEFKQYYSRLTEIIRRYMERRYGIPAMEMTSYEILEAWTGVGEGREDLTGKLNRLLNLADLVKFAKQKPVASENEENMEIAYDFVEKTKWVKPDLDDEKEATEDEPPAGEAELPANGSRQAALAEAENIETDKK
jgi:hypothetical protein